MLSKVALYGVKVAAYAVTHRGVLFGALIRSAAGADGTAGGAEIAAILADHRVVATFAT